MITIPSNGTLSGCYSDLADDYISKLLATGMEGDSFELFLDALDQLLDDAASTGSAAERALAIAGVTGALDALRMNFMEIAKAYIARYSTDAPPYPWLGIYDPPPGTRRPPGAPASKARTFIVCFTGPGEGTVAMAKPDSPRPPGEYGKSWGEDYFKRATMADVKEVLGQK